VVTELDREGRILQGAKVQELAYGALIPTASERLNAVDGALRGAGFDARLSDIIQQEMWEKWVQLASLGAVTCLLRGNIGEIEAAPGGAELSLAILNECVSILRACGHPPGEAVVARAKSAMTAVGSQSTSSMYRDLAKGAKVEVDSILGDLLERGRAAGVAAPLTEAAFVNLRIYQGRIGRG
jgi:2-dehydropantoate 2-reductase